MQLITWNPMTSLDRLMSSLPAMPFERFGWDMAIDVYENEKAGTIVATMNLPGIDQKNIDISAEKDKLTIAGNREERKEENSRQYYNKEILRGSFSRTVDLPKSVDPAKAEAHYKDGVLTVSLPVAKSKEQSAVKVDITA